MRSAWATMIIELSKEHRVSERKLCSVTGLNRATFRRFLSGETSLPSADLETLLSAFGFELDAFRVGDVDPSLVPEARKTRESVTARTCPPNLTITRKLVPFAGQTGCY